MALTKTVAPDKIEVVTDFKHLQIRTATVIKEDDKELNRSLSRKSLPPGDISGDDNTYTKTDVSGEAEEVKNIAGVVWTDAVHDAWKAHLISVKR